MQSEPPDDSHIFPAQIHFVEGIPFCLPCPIVRREFMNVKRTILTAVIVAAIAALALPIVGGRIRASGASSDRKAAASSWGPAPSPKPAAADSANLVVSRNPVGGGRKRNRKPGTFLRTFSRH